MNESNQLTLKNQVCECKLSKTMKVLKFILKRKKCLIILSKTRSVLTQFDTVKTDTTLLCKTKLPYQFHRLQTTCKTKKSLVQTLE
jgi:hypothetical protein